MELESSYQRGIGPGLVHDPGDPQTESGNLSLPEGGLSHGRRLRDLADERSWLGLCLSQGPRVLPLLQVDTSQSLSIRRGHDWDGLLVGSTMTDVLAQGTGSSQPTFTPTERTTSPWALPVASSPAGWSGPRPQGYDLGRYVQ